LTLIILFDEKKANNFSFLCLQKHYEFSGFTGDANRATVATVEKQCGHTKSKETEKISSSFICFHNVISNADIF